MQGKYKIHRPPVSSHQNLVQPITSEVRMKSMEFTNNQPSTSRVLLPLELDFSNMSDPSIVIEPPDNKWRSDNKLISQTSLSGRRSRRDQSRDKHRSKKRRRRRSSSTSSSRSTSSDSRKRKSKRSKHSHRKRKRRYTSSSSSSSVSDNQVHDYGRYQSRYSPQAVQNPQVLKPEEIPNVQTMTPEQTLQGSSRDSGLYGNLVL